jgi:hypothetical protein
MHVQFSSKKNFYLKIILKSNINNKLNISFYILSWEFITEN